MITFTCVNSFHVTPCSKAVLINTSNKDLVLLSTQQIRDLAGGTAGVTGPLVPFCIFCHCHVGDWSLWGLPWNVDVVRCTGRVYPHVSGRTRSWSRSGERWQTSSNKGNPMKIKTKEVSEHTCYYFVPKVWRAGTIFSLSCDTNAVRFSTL